ncbi:MAG: hypothetical protein AAFZ38_07350 [Myxococcota bacterium]
MSSEFEVWNPLIGGALIVASAVAVFFSPSVVRLVDVTASLDRIMLGAYDDSAREFRVRRCFRGPLDIECCNPPRESDWLLGHVWIR